MNKIPITLGIIGHLDSIITDEHKKMFIALLNELNTKYPNSPISLFSQLAKGADTEIANVFIEIKEKQNREYNLIVPLPYEIESFKKAFNKEELERFNTLISKSESNFVLENEENESQEDLYRTGGQFVADSSIVLIAIWDGKINNKKGGTSDIVKYKIEGSFKEEVEEYLFDQDGTLISLLCNRTSDTEKQKLPVEKNILEDLLRDTSILKALEKIEEFNFSAINSNQQELKNSATYLYDNIEELSDTGKKTIDYYSSTDTQAIKHQKNYSYLIKIFFLLGFFIISVFEAYKHLNLEPKLFVITMLLIVGAFIIFKLSHKWYFHSKFIEDRILTEALRIHFFWNSRNLYKSTKNHILRIHKTEYNWVKHILSAVYGLTYNPNNKQLSIDSIQKYWIDNQYNYFIKKIEELTWKKKVFSIFSTLFLTVAFIALLGVFWLHHLDHHHHWLHPLIVIDSILFGMFALTKSYYNIKAYEQTSNQYSLMKDIYKATQDKIKKIITSNINQNLKDKQVNNVLYLAGKEALVENGNWYLIFKEKEPEVEGVGG